jgi:trans-aconitate methyltransferase
MANTQELRANDEADDSGFEDASSLQSTSLASSVLNYTYENGRRYHAYDAGSYPLPNDEREQARMDLLHHIWLTMLGGELLLKKPVNPQRILDVGTGTGIWAISMADEYPEAIVIGTDLSPIQPGWLPPNCLFYVDNAESDWTYAPFDLIHGRSLGGSISGWPRFYRQCFDSLKPGGLLEMQEHDVWISTIEKEMPPWTADWNVTLNEASASFGKYLNVASKYVDCINCQPRQELLGLMGASMWKLREFREIDAID